MPMTTKDCAVPPANCPLSYGTKMLRRRKRWHTGIVAAIIMGLMGGSFVIGIGYALFAAIQPPVTVQNSYILNPVVEQGADLKFLVTYMTAIDRSCMGSVTREFYVPIDIEVNGVIKHMREKKRIVGSPPIVIDGETEYVIDVPLPPNMGVGDWEFQGETSYDCGWIWALVRDFPRGVLNGGVKRFRTRIMPFRVVATMQ